MNLKSYILFLLCIFVYHIGSSQDYSPVEFIANKGQWQKDVQFKADVPSGAIFVHNDGLTVVQHKTSDMENARALILGHKDDESPMPRNTSITVRSHAYRIQFLNTLSSRQVIADKPLNSHVNYFIGKDPSKWASNCGVFQGITIKNLYPHIDLRYYSNNGQVKYDLIVNPGADVSQIALKYDGVDGLDVKDRQLRVATSVGTVTELKPYSYQYADGQRKEVMVNYVVKDNIVRFDVKNYNRNATLVIDPTLVFVSFSGSRADTWGYTATYGPDGSLYGGGIVFSEGWPVNKGAYDETWGGGDGESGFDIGIVKLSSRGNQRLFATYIGGSGNEQPHSLIADSQGNLIIAGRTNSGDYPTTGTPGTIGGGGGYDIILSKLSADGSQLLASKKIGGKGDDGVNIDLGHNAASSLQQNYGDDARSEVQLDDAGNIYLASCTRSDNFPYTTNAFQKNSGGMQDGVVIKMPPDLSSLSFSTYLGGVGNDAAYVISISPVNGLAYVAGGTESEKNFPGIKAGPMGASFNGNIDGFVSMINTNSGTVESVYIGTSNIDQVYGLKFDKFGYPYVTGQTLGTWPIKKADPTQPFYADNNGRNFIAKLEKNLSGFVYSTVFGTGATYPNISPIAFLVDRCENVYVSGWGGNMKGFRSAGTSGLKVKNSVVKNTTDGNDFYFFVLTRNATSQLYGDFFGQDGGFTDHVDGGTSRFDANGVIYQAICANCDPPPRPTFPTTPGSAEPVNRSKFCDLAMIKVAFNFAGVHVGLQASINGVANDTSGCVPVTVVFKDTIQNHISPNPSYEWDFGDNTPAVTTPEPTTQHTYNQVGFYKVRVIVTDPESCNIYDTAYVHIRVGNNEAKPAFTPERVLPCSSNKFRFVNKSVAPNGPAFGPQTFVWNFGDGSPLVTAGTETVEHQYTAPGTYKVRLYIYDTAYCNAPDSAVVDVRISPALKAQFEAPANGCAPSAVTFRNTSTGGQQFVWDFGDGTTVQSSDEFVSHIYTTPGTYTVKLIATEPDPCFTQDSASTVIVVFDKPRANFEPTPQPPQLNAPITFTNLSLNATNYKWFFGDGDSLETTSTQPFSHDYNATGNYNACLIAYNANGCTDTLCKPVQVLVSTSVDVPNAFTPLSGDINSKVGVRGYGIAKMTFTIYNRWGQKMFETNSRNEGWDGRYKGVLQPMDVYAYTLKVEFTDGKKLTKHGDITLIR